MQSIDCLPSHSIPASKCISTFAQSQPPSASSVTNSSKSAVRFRVWVGTDMDPFRWVLTNQKTKLHRSRSFFGQFHNFVKSELWLCYVGTLIPIINTIFIRLSTAANQILVLSQDSTSYLVTLNRAHHSSSSVQCRSSEIFSNGDNPEVMY